LSHAQVDLFASGDLAMRLFFGHTDFSVVRPLVCSRLSLISIVSSRYRLALRWQLDRPRPATPSPPGASKACSRASTWRDSKTSVEWRCSPTTANASARGNGPRSANTSAFSYLPGFVQHPYLDGAAEGKTAFDAFIVRFHTWRLVKKQEVHILSRLW
jgi:hypothetical protein